MRIPRLRLATRSRRRRGLSALELLFSVGLIALLAAIVLATVSRARSSAQAVQCLANLRKIGAAFTLYASEHGSRLPDPAASETTWESTILRYVPSPAVFRCPSDEEVFPALGSSYDWRDAGEPATSVAGRIIHACRPDAVLAFEALPGWHRKKTMNAVRIDGAAMSMSEQECLSDLRRSATVNGLKR